MPQGGHPLRGSFVSYTVHWKKCDQICQSLGLDLIEFDHRLAVQLSTDSTLGTRWATCLGHSSLGGLVTCLLARCSWPEYGQLRYSINFYTGLLSSAVSAPSHQQIRWRPGSLFAAGRAKVVAILFSHLTALLKRPERTGYTPAVIVRSPGKCRQLN